MKEAKVGGFITIVSGLPRTGTSLMMKMLEAGGIAVVTDNFRQADIDNPGGYYEFEAVKKIKEDASWLDGARGKVFKMVSMLLKELPAGMRYKVIFMERAMSEVLASQEKMLKRQGKDTAVDDPDKMRRLYEQHLVEIKEWLGLQNNMDVLYVSYNGVMDDPLGSVRMVDRFLGGGLDVERMAGVVNEALYRNRAAVREPLEEKVSRALGVIRAEIAAAGNAAVAFGGGKDSVVLLHLVRTAAPEGPAIPVLCLDPPGEYPALYYFIEKMRKLWGLNLRRVKASAGQGTSVPGPGSGIYPGMEALARAASGLGFSRLLTGLRADEQGVSGEAGQFTQCGQVILVNPMFGFTERDAWDFIGSRGLLSCSLYSGRAGKLGCLPGSALHVRPGESDKGLVKENLRALGYM